MNNDTVKAEGGQVIQQIYDHHLADLRKSGLLDETIALAGITSLPGSVLSKKLGFPAHGDGYAIPYPGIKFARYKIFGGEQKYLSHAGAGVYLYVPANLPESDILVITEGEKKALAACQSGIACVAVGGVDMWSRQDAAERASKCVKTQKGEVIEIHPKTVETPVLPELLARCEGKRVVVLADSDAEQNRRVKDAMTLLAQAINHQINVDAVKFLACPVGTNDAKQGLDDWLIASGVDAVREAIEKAAHGRIWMPDRLAIPFTAAPFGVKARNGHLYFRLRYESEGEPFLPNWTKDVVVDDKDGVKTIVRQEQHGVPYCWVGRLHRIASTNNDEIVDAEDVREAEVFAGITDSRNYSEVKIMSGDFDDKKFWRNFGFGGENFQVWKQILIAQKQAGGVPQTLSVLKRGWLTYKGFRYYAYGDDTVISSKSADAAGVKVELFTRSSPLRQASGISQSGTYEGERDIFKDRVLRNPALAVIAGFAASGPLLGLLGTKAESGILHLFGSSGHGKTTAQRIAAALIGSPGKPGESGAYCLSWRMTENGVESPLESRDDAFICLDELHSLPRNANALELLYMAANGRGKQRMTKEIEARAAKGWSTQLLSSGEISFRSRLLADGYADMPGGLQFRTIDLPIGEIPYLQDWTGAQVMQLEGDLMQHHGHAWPVLINLLIANESIVSTLFDQIDAAVSARAIAGQSRIFERRRKHISLALTGLALLCSVYDIPEAEAAEIKNAAIDWAVTYMWPAGLNSLIGDEGDDMVMMVETWMVANTNRFIRLGVSSGITRDVVGAIDQDGYACLFEKGGIADVAKSLSLDGQRMKAALLNAGWQRKQRRIFHKPIWCYVSKDPVFSHAPDSEDLDA